MKVLNRYILMGMAVFVIALQGISQDKIDKIQSHREALEFFRDYMNLQNFRFTTGYEVMEKVTDKKTSRDSVKYFVKGSDWAKIDIDLNGRDDLVISGCVDKLVGKHTIPFFYCSIFLSSDTGIRIINLVPKWSEDDPFYFNIIRIENAYKIELARYSGYSMTKDTLEYWNGFVMNYNANPGKSRIKNVAYYKNSAWSNKGDYIEISALGKMIRKNGEWWKADTPISEASISEIEAKDFFRLLGYADPGRLNRYYEKGLRDNTKTNLVVVYENGYRKEIQDDAGSYGTYSLAAIYDRIEFFISKAKWKN